MRDDKCSIYIKTLRNERSKRGITVTMLTIDKGEGETSECSVMKFTDH